MSIYQFYTHKPGQGASTCAALFAASLASKTQSVLYIDRSLSGDAFAIFGASSNDDTIKEREVMENLVLRRTPNAGPFHELDLSVALRNYDFVVVDHGAYNASIPDVGNKVLVTRRCYLALRAAVSANDTDETRPVVVVSEQERALSISDVKSAIGGPVIEVPWDSAIALSVDAGMLCRSRPISARRDQFMERLLLSTSTAAAQ